MDANTIEDVFDKEIDTLYLNFSDPWPKDRHAKRRLTSDNFLAKYENIFKKERHIVMKTDNIDGTTQCPQHAKNASLKTIH